MNIAAGIFLIAVGAIFTYAIEADIAGINIDTVGTILMIAGAAVTLISLFFMASGKRVVRDDVVVDERRDVPRA